MDGGNEAFILFCVSDCLSITWRESSIIQKEKNKKKITCNFQTFSTRLGTFDQKRD
jgi:hypothetical protein